MATEWDFLDCCSHVEWKFAADLARELSREGSRVPIAQVFVFIESLEDKGHVETRRVPSSAAGNGTRLGVRKTPAGIEARIQASQRDAGTNSDLGLKPA